MNDFNKNAYIVAGIVVAALILVGMVFFGAKNKPAPEVIPAVQPVTETPIATEAELTKKETQVSYTDNGFTPGTLKVKVGMTAIFTNVSRKKMWVASNPHPLHTDLTGFDQLKAVDSGGTYTYIFDKVGTWGYHNHIAPGDTGVVVVE